MLSTVFFLSSHNDRMETLRDVLSRLTLTSLVVAALFTVSGCGENRPNLAKVSGQVLIDGQPLEFGHVRFIPTGARSSDGKLDETGHFTLTCYDGDDGAVLGVHRIEVSSGEPLNANQMRWHAPKKYANYNTSDLQQEITGSTDTVVVNLSWGGGKPFVEGAAGGSAAQNKTPTRGRD